MPASDNMWSTGANNMTAIREGLPIENVTESFIIKDKDGKCLYHHVVSTFLETLEEENEEKCSSMFDGCDGDVGSTYGVWGF